jgi:hypothetical protein
MACSGAALLYLETFIFVCIDGTGQGWPPYGKREHTDTYEGFLDTRHSLLSQFWFSGQPCYHMKNTYVYMYEGVEIVWSSVD